MENNYLNHTVLIKDDTFILHSNGVPCECPFKSSVPAQDEFGRIKFISQPCTSRCPLFNYEEVECEPTMVDDTNVGTIEVESTVVLSCGKGSTYVVGLEMENKVKPLIN